MKDNSGLDDEKLREAIGRAWCHEENVAKEMDADLAEAVLWEIRAALADAAPPAEQAGDVGQAWRVKPLVWHNYDAWTWWAESTSGTYRVEERNGTWRATLNLPMTEHIIYEYETDGTPNDFEAAHLACESDHAARITAALEPEPTPALSWRAMQTAAERAAAKITLIGSDAQQQHASLETSLAIRDAILAMTGPSDEQALAEAVNLPEVQEFAAIMKEVLRVSDRSTPLWNSAHAALVKIGKAK